MDDINRWTKDFPTPFYVYDGPGIRKSVNELKDAFSWNEGFKEYFAIKATPTPAILRIMRDEGCGADCASVAEMTLAMASGITGQNIMLSSNQTTASEYKEAARFGAIINLDDLTQVENMENAIGIPDTICLRYNPGVFHITNDIMGRLYDSKFGMTKAQLFESCLNLRHKGTRHFGLHAMLSSCSLDNDYFPQLAKELFRLVVEIKEKIDLDIEFVDLSGGIGIPYKPTEEAVDISLIGQNVKEMYDEIIEGHGLKLRIFTELGRYITGPHGYLITKVTGFKHIYKEYVGVDATACDLLRPAMYGAYHHISVPGKENEPDGTIVDVVGSLCENNDKFAIDRLLPKLEIGDILVIQDAGAHSRSMGYNYNGKMRCAELLMDKDHNVNCIRRAETMNDYLATLDVDALFMIKLGRL